MNAAARTQSFRTAITTLILAVCGTQSAVGAGDAKNELIAAEKSLAASVVALDFATLDRLYAEDFVFSHSTGVVETKADWLNYLQGNPDFYTSRSVDSIEVEMHGDVAVTSGRLYITTNSENPERRAFRIWYIRVYEHRDDRWQLLSHRSIREQAGPPDE